MCSNRFTFECNNAEIRIMKDNSRTELEDGFCKKKKTPFVVLPKNFGKKKVARMYHGLSRVCRKVRFVYIASPRRHHQLGKTRVARVELALCNEYAHISFWRPNHLRFCNYRVFVYNNLRVFLLIFKKTA